MMAKFPCPHCRNLMGIGTDLLGRKVRCPHCQQILVAPPAEPAVAPALSDSGAIDYNLPVRQDHDSIFGDAADEDILGIGGGTSPTAFTEAEDESPFAPPEPPEPPVYIEPAEAPPPLPHEPAGRGTNPLQSLVLALLVPYSILMTVVAAWSFYKYQFAPHPLELIQDLGDFQKTTKKLSAQVLKLPSATLPLPARLVTSLNDPLTVGDLEITPARVEQKPVKAFRKRQGDADPDVVTAKHDSLVLHLKLKNVSNDVEFYPTDPYFDRRPRDGGDRPFTAVEVGGKFFHGGAIRYLPESGRVEREWLEGQEGDNRPLPPGRERQTVVCTFPGDPVIAELNKAGQALWRVHVRRGLYRYKGRDLPVTAVVGVRFSAKDVVKIN